MEKYNTLIGKKINIHFNDDVINTYKIKTIKDTGRILVGLEGTGKIFVCDVDFDNKEISKGIKKMEFPASVFDDLINTGIARNPMQPNMYFKCVGKEKMN